MDHSPYCPPSCDRDDHLPCLDEARAKATALAQTGPESPEYHLGHMAARVDIEAGRERDESAGLWAPLDWLRGYDHAVQIHGPGRLTERINVLSGYLHAARDTCRHAKRELDEAIRQHDEANADSLRMEASACDLAGQLDELRSAARKAADDLQWVINGIGTGMPARENVEECLNIQAHLRSLAGVEDTTTDGYGRCGDMVRVGSAAFEEEAQKRDASIRRIVEEQRVEDTGEETQPVKTADEVKVGTVWTGVLGMAAPMKVLKVDGDRALIGHVGDPGDCAWEARSDVASVFDYHGVSPVRPEELAAAEAAFGEDTGEPEETQP